MSASKKLRRAVQIRKRTSDRLARRVRERAHAADLAARREAAKNDPPSEERVPTGMLPASMALAAMALAGSMWA